MKDIVRLYEGLACETWSKVVNPGGLHTTVVLLQSAQPITGQQLIPEKRCQSE